MRKADDVFFFTLIDFLVQVFFFGLLLYAFSLAAQKETRTKEARERTEALAAAGVSDLVELRDFLTRLAPVDQLQGMSEYITKAGGLDHIKHVLQVVNQAGGIEQVEKDAAKRRADQGSGKRHCVSREVDGRTIGQPVATFVADDTSIRLEAGSPEFDVLLGELGRNAASVASLSLPDFRNVFAAVIQKHPDCRYTVRLVEQTRSVDARDAVGSAFYHLLVKRSHAP